MKIVKEWVKEISPTNFGMRSQLEQMHLDKHVYEWMKRYTEEYANQLKSPPIVETDKLREEFKKSFIGLNNPEMLNIIFDFFLPHLSVSKEVEVSDEEMSAKKIIQFIDNGLKGNVIPLDIERDTIQLIERKWMRDKQGIASCKVKEKST